MQKGYLCRGGTRKAIGARLGRAKGAGDRHQEVSRGLRQVRAGKDARGPERLQGQIGRPSLKRTQPHHSPLNRPSPSDSLEKGLKSLSLELPFGF